MSYRKHRHSSSYDYPKSRRSGGGVMKHKYPRGGNGVRQFNGDYYYGLGLKPQPTKSAAQKLAENQREKTNFWTGEKTKARVVKNRGGWDVFTT